MTKWITVLFWVFALSISSIAMATVDDGVTVTGEKGFFRFLQPIRFQMASSLSARTITT